MLRANVRCMVWPFRPRMIECTCLACGQTWMLKAALAHDKRTGRSRRGFSAADHRPGALYGGGMEMQVAEAHRRDAQADRALETMRQLRSCPKCGSERYTFRRSRG